MTHRAHENILIIGNLILLVYLITPSVPERWSGADRLPQFKEQTEQMLRSGPTRKQGGIIVPTAGFTEN